MRRLLTFSWKLGLIGGAFGLAVMKPNYVSLEDSPESKQRLRELITRAKLSFEGKYGVAFPEMELNVDNNVKKASFDFSTPKSLDHLTVFNKMLEFFSIYNKYNVLDIEKKTRKFINDVVIYSLNYRRSDSIDRRTTVYLIGDTKKNTYRLTVEKDTMFERMELIILTSIIRQIQDYGACYETASPKDKLSIEEFLCSLGGEMVKAEKNDFNINETFGSASIKKNLNEILKHKSEENKLKYMPLIEFKGPKNTGKTLLAKALAYELNLPLLKISLTNLKVSTEEEIKDSIQLLNSIGKAIILIADIDLIEDSKALYRSVYFIERLRESSKGYIIVTNSSQSAKLPLTKVINLELPNETVRAEVLKKYTPHLTEKGQETLNKKLTNLTIKDIIDLCRKIKGYWNKHYKESSTGNLEPPLRIYMEFVEEKIVEEKNNH